jgi:hypothetical protein
LKPAPFDNGAPLTHVAIFYTFLLLPELSVILEAKVTCQSFCEQVDAGSPADVSGLRDGDLIVAVNGVPVLESGKCTHEQLADRIKSIPDKVDIIVVDQVVEKRFRERGLLLTDHLRDQLAPTDEAAAETPVETTAEPAIDTAVETAAEATPETTAVNASAGKSAPLSPIFTAYVPRTSRALDVRGTYVIRPSDACTQESDT